MMEQNFLVIYGTEVDIHNVVVVLSSNSLVTAFCRVYGVECLWAGIKVLFM